MGTMRLTQQEADPIGAITAAPIVTVGAVLAAVTAVALTWAHWSEVGSPFAAVLGVVLVMAAGVVAAVSAAPARAPFTAERLWLVVALGVGGAIAEYVSTIGANRYLYDDFGPAATGMLILSVAPYCTWLSLVLAGVLSSAVLSILVVGSVEASTTGGPIISLLLVNATPMLAMAAAAAGYSYTMVSQTLAWQREANRAALRRDAELRAGFARSSEQSRVSVLGREVLPFLAGVMTADRISVAEADRARELAEALRRALRAGIESTWLDDLAERILAATGVATVIHDPAGAAADLAGDQRSALTSLITWLGDPVRSRGIRTSFTTDADRSRISIVAQPGDVPPTRRELDRFVAVARSVGLRAEGAVTRENVTVELSYAAE